MGRMFDPLLNLTDPGEAVKEQNSVSAENNRAVETGRQESRCRPRINQPKAGRNRE